MPLNLSNGGEYTPHIRYMASTSSWSMSTENGMQPFTFEQAVFDLENIQTGWAFFGAEQAPEWVMDQSLSQMAPKPQDGREWKRGFKINVYSQKMFGEQQPVREFATSATGAVMGIDDLYTQYESQKDANAGKLPVVAYKGATPKKVGKGNTTVPQLEIIKFVDRPDELKDGVPVPANQSANQSVQPAQASSSGTPEF